MKMFPPLCSFFALIFIIAQMTMADRSADRLENNLHRVIIGAIVDNSSHVGKEERVAMEMALVDFNNYSNQNFTLHIKYSQREPVQAAFAARDLINRQQVQVILGTQTWKETLLVADVSSQNQIPFLSFTDSIPQWAAQRWPFLVQASPNKHLQMKALASIVQSFGWHQVTVIYEDTDSSASGVIPHLSDALKEVGAEISYSLALPPFSSSSFSKQLGRLKRGQCKVFVVHLSLPMALHLFEKARKMKMMEKGYVWIMTDTFTSLVHSLNASTISSMQGIIGIKSYFPDKGPHFVDFNERFCKRFRLEQRESYSHEPGIFAVRAYDAMWAVALAMKEGYNEGHELLEKILLSDFHGLSGRVQFVNQKVAPAHTFQIINVVGKSYRELGFWSDGMGFSETINDNATCSNSIRDLGQIFWPGGPWNTPQGWTTSTGTKALRIGVPINGISITKWYVNVVYDKVKNDTSYGGFAIELFNAAVEKLPFYLPYNFFPFNGTIDALVEQIHLKNFDAAVGHISIVARRYQHAEFTQPYTEAELVMITLTQTKTSNKAWLFTRPFTMEMWLLIVAINIYNGFVVWSIERNYSSEFKGSMLEQIGSLLWLSFATLFSLHGEKQHSNLSRVTVVVWLFVALVIMQTYVANLSSILTVQELEPIVDNIESLKNSNAMIGHSKISFITRYLVDVLYFNPQNMKNYTSAEDFAKDLRNGAIAAVFLDAPLAKIFLARYCKGFTKAGPTFKVGGYGFAFPRGSSLLPYLNEALLQVSETGQLRDLETSMIASQNCVEVESENETPSLSPSSFWLLFIFTGGTSTITLVSYVACCKYKMYEHVLVHKTIGTLVSTIYKCCGHQKERFSRRNSDVEGHDNPPNA